MGSCDNESRAEFCMIVAGFIVSLLLSPSLLGKLRKYLLGNLYIVYLNRDVIIEEAYWNGEMKWVMYMYVHRG